MTASLQAQADTWNAENPVGTYGNLTTPRREHCTRVQAPAHDKDGVIVATFYGLGEHPAARFHKDATND